MITTYCLSCLSDPCPTAWALYSHYKPSIKVINQFEQRSRSPTILFLLTTMDPVNILFCPTLLKTSSLGGTLYVHGILMALFDHHISVPLMQLLSTFLKVQVSNRATCGYTPNKTLCKFLPGFHGHVSRRDIFFKSLPRCLYISTLCITGAPSI